MGNAKRKSTALLQNRAKQALSEQVAVEQAEVVGPEKTDMTSLSIRLPKVDFLAFQKLCEDREVSMSHALRSLMKFYKSVK